MQQLELTLTPTKCAFHNLHIDFGAPDISRNKEVDFVLSTFCEARGTIRTHSLAIAESLCYSGTSSGGKHIQVRALSAPHNGRQDIYASLVNPKRILYVI
jgi:hypothetical protein